MRPPSPEGRHLRNSRPGRGDSETGLEMSVALPQFQITQRESTSGELARKMIDYLLSGMLRAGQRIPSERQLSEALGVGRGAIREAIKSLSLLGLVEQRQGDGTFLSRSSSDLLPQVIEWGLLLGEPRIDDLTEARTHLEIVLAGLAAERRDDASLGRMRKLIREMSAPRVDLEHYIECDIAFHLEIANASGNTVLAGVLHTVKSLLQVWTGRVIRAAGETETSLAMHTPILKAIERKDQEAARRAMAAHMERANRRLRATREAEASAGRKPIQKEKAR
jgi:GntR family transcriptional regulator, transcriptional repressor for pyruvate dehydrogenase complex